MGNVVGGLLGGAGGANGTGFNPQTGQAILNPTTVAQANNAATNTQGGLQQQQSLVNALVAQNGIGNQSNVFNQLQGVANGTGPNPAQAQLAQATGANTANQAALMAGQRGAGQNAGLIARQAAQQGAANQQNAAGQAATMQANQSLNALNQLGGIAGQQVAQQQAAVGQNNQALQNEQQILLNSIQGQNQANVGLSGQQAGLAGQQMQGQQGLIGNITGGIGSALGLAHGGRVAMAGGGYTPVSVDYNNNDPVFQNSPTASGATPLDMPLPPPQAPATVQAPAAPSIPQVSAPAAPQSSVGKFFSGFNQSQNQVSGQPQLQGMNLAGNTIGKGIGAGLSALFGSGSGSNDTTMGGKNRDTDEEYLKSDIALNDAADQAGVPSNMGKTVDLDASNNDQPVYAKGGKVPAMVSPGEIRIPAKDVKKVAKGEKSPLSGEKIKGKAPVPGAKDDYANDIVPKDLNEGDIILPRSVTQSKHPHWEAHKFVSQIMAKNGGMIPKKGKK